MNETMYSDLPVTYYMVAAEVLSVRANGTDRFKATLLAALSKHGPKSEIVQLVSDSVSLEDPKRNLPWWHPDLKFR